MSLAVSPVAIRLPVWRSRFVLAAFIAVFGVLAARSIYLQTMRMVFLQEMGEARYSRVIAVPATRGRVLDRSGEALAVSTPVQSVWAIPADFQASDAQKAQLARALGIDVAEIDAKLANEARDFVYLKRQLSPEVAANVGKLGLPGVHQQREFRRYYPGGEAFAHLVGFTGVDDAGQEGIELAFQSKLGGLAGSRRVIKDRLGRIVEDAGSIRAAQDGHDLVLSIDSKIQSLAYVALKSALEKHRAKAGAIVALDVLSGEVLALANVPSYNPNNRAKLGGAQLRNRALTDTFEPGSTLKPLTVALALELGKVTPTTTVQTGGGRLTIANYTIHDAHRRNDMSVTEVIQKSSNVGSARIALSMPREAMWDMFRHSGLGSAPLAGFPGAATGKLRPYKSWRPIEQATMAYGHGLSVSLMQLARAYTLFARDGELVPLTLLRSARHVNGEKVLSTRTARAMRVMLEAAVQPGGTAPRARIMGWRVAGKTGTAHKQENGGYAAKKYISSFVGFAPVSAPRVVIAVMLDEPSGKEYYGGAVAAPVFAQVMQGALRLLGTPFDAPLQAIALPGDGEEAKEGT